MSGWRWEFKETSHFQIKRFLLSLDIIFQNDRLLMSVPQKLNQGIFSIVEGQLAVNSGMFPAEAE